MIKGYIEWREKHYGMKCLSLEEELALSESERSTRSGMNTCGECKYFDGYSNSCVYYYAQFVENGEDEEACDRFDYR